MREANLKTCPLCKGTMSIVLMGDEEQEWWMITRGVGDNACTCRLFLEGQKFSKYLSIEKKELLRQVLIERWNQRESDEEKIIRLEKESDGEEKQPMRLIDANEQVGEGYLQDWYINSVLDDEPVWTEAHIEELCQDFVVIPKEMAKTAYDVEKVLEEIDRKAFDYYTPSGYAIDQGDVNAIVKRGGRNE